MPLIVVLSNPNSDGNRRDLARMRRFCIDRADVMNVEVPNIAAIGPALDRIAAARADVLAINGGDGTVQAVLTEIHAEDAPARKLPPIAVLPGGRTNLIAKDMGAIGDPIRALERVIALAEEGVDGHLATRQLISLRTGPGERPTFGMFLAAGALADIMLFCRHKLYPRGIPTWFAHLLTVIAGLVSVITDTSARFLPPVPRESKLSVGERRLQGRFQVLMVSTLQALVLTGKLPASRMGSLCLISLDRHLPSVFRAVWAGFTGQLGRVSVPGLNFTSGSEIRLAEGITNVIMDGESFSAKPGEPIVLKPAPSVCFVDLRGTARVTEATADEAPSYGSARAEPVGVSPLSNARSHSQPL